VNRKDREDRRYHLPILGKRMNLRLDRLRHDLDEAARKVAGGARKAGTTCRTDCFGCCYQLVLVGLAEALLMVRWLNRHGRITTEMIDRLQRAAGQSFGTTATQHFRQAIPCVFLDQSTPDHHCTIYPVRPFACATYWTKVDDPAVCYPTAKLDIPVVDTSVAAAWYLVHTGEVEAALRKTDGTEMYLPAPLPIALLVAIDMMARGVGAIDAWTARTPEDQARARSILDRSGA